jgi:alkanesulfonate monooxygenase SsuD/methylene tetrahydromethanopterin reductase-like flavin-dependent oxidoreductase (luciferase family)
VKFALTYHVEGPRDRPSLAIYEEIAAQVELADRLGFDYAWFAEHHAHIHLGHLPCPLLFALHLAGRTRRIQLGTAVICLNMHHPIEVAEQIAVADLLTGGRISPGFGSGSTPQELALFELPSVDAATRHARFEESLAVVRAVWAGGQNGRMGEWENGRSGPELPLSHSPIPPFSHSVPLPVARPDLTARSWVAANSLEAAGIAGRGGHNMMFSFLRPPEQYEALYAAYRAAGGQRSVAANRPIYVGEDDAGAWAEAEPALRLLFHRFREEGKISRETAEPARFDATNAPGQFLVGGPDTIVRFIRDLRARIPFDTFNVEPRWAGFSPGQVQASMQRFADRVMPELQSARTARRQLE